MSLPLNKNLYAKAKKKADETYGKHTSAYKSGFIVKYYKGLGGKYKTVGKDKKLKRWFREKWVDVGNKSYPVFRPTKRISKKTPLLKDEIDKKNLKQQIAKKQKIKGKTLPPFKKKR